MRLTNLINIMGINMHIFVKNTSGYNAVSVEDGSIKRAKAMNAIFAVCNTNH